jgi:riboflavin kinase/FMN adenylyltransferase
MQVIDDLTKANLPQETILTIGAFDGVHRGHQALVEAIVTRATTTGRLATLITFHPHPVMVLAPERAPRYLTTPGEKMALLESLGLDLVVLLPFDRKMAATPAGQFMELVCGHLRPHELWVGGDFALGRNREGDVPRLRELGQRLGYTVQVFELVPTDGEIISSSRIRRLLREGRVREATTLLGRYPGVAGQVVAGAGRGWSLGFPTANLEVRRERAVPADGAYAVFAVLGVDRYPAVANIGLRPSFDNGRRTVETHILDFDEDIYGCDLVVEFVERLRDEKPFGNVADLVAQIERDCQAARRLLGIELADAGTEEGEVEWCRYRYREVAHTADRALHVWGRDLADLFLGAAKGMYSLMADLDGLVATEWRHLRLEALDPAALLVDWLNELLFLTEAEGLLFLEGQIPALDGATLAARVGGVVAPVTGAHIKAATYHDLELVQGEAGWSTVITFDV